MRLSTGTFVVCFVSLAFNQFATASAAEGINESLYREAQPATLMRNEGASQQATNSDREKLSAEFKEAYYRANKPKIALFWDRTLSDNVTSEREATASVDGNGVRPRDNFQVSVHVSVKGGSEKAFSLAPPARAAEFESGFVTSFRQAGAIFVDRSTIIRLSSLNKTKEGQQSSQLDYQTLEMSALADYAQYFAEVNYVPDVESTGGLEVRVTVISASTGEVIADVLPISLYKTDKGADKWVSTESGIRPGLGDDVSATQWRADAAGFSKISLKKSGVEEGRRVAFELMAQLTQKFSE